MTLTFTDCARRRRLASRRPATTPHAIVLVSALVPVLVVVALGIASLLR